MIPVMSERTDRSPDRIYFAPMEGITTKTYRMVHKEVYSEPDLYF